MRAIPATKVAKDRRVKAGILVGWVAFVLLLLLFVGCGFALDRRQEQTRRGTGTGRIMAVVRGLVQYSTLPGMY